MTESSDLTPIEQLQKEIEASDIVIVRMGRQIEELQRQNQNLLASNNGFEERARKAERRVRQILASPEDIAGAVAQKTATAVEVMLRNRNIGED
jgi:L-asparaginase II